MRSAYTRLLTVVSSSSPKISCIGRDRRGEIPHFGFGFYEEVEPAAIKIRAGAEIKKPTEAMADFMSPSDTLADAKSQIALDKAFWQGVDQTKTVIKGGHAEIL